MVVKYDGMYFDSFSQFSDEMNDTILLEPNHLDISIKDLTVIGTVYHLEDTNLHSNWKQVDGDIITSDSVIFELSPNGDSVEPVIFIDPRSTKPVDRYSGRHHQLYLDYLEDESSVVEIRDNGILDAGELAYLREQVRKLNYKPKQEVTQFNSIQLQINIGYPETVKELLEKVRAFKKKVNENII